MTSALKEDPLPEFCTILNTALKTDNEKIIQIAVTLCRGINSLLVARRVIKNDNTQY